MSRISFPMANLVPQRNVPEIQRSAPWTGGAQGCQLIAICRIHLMKDAN